MPSLQTTMPNDPRDAASAMTPSQILAEPVRVYLVELLCSGATTSGDLATMCHSRFGIGWSSVSRHLRRLERSGFVRRMHDGAERWVALEPDWLERASSEVERLRELWEAERPNRRLGVGGELYDTAARAWPGRDAAAAESPAGFEADSSAATARGRRGRTRVDRAAIGSRRSADSPAADGGGSFD